MGKIQCTNTRYLYETFNMIESELNVSNNDPQKKILNEFLFLRDKLMYHNRQKNLNSNTFDSYDAIFEKITQKIYSNSKCITLKTRIGRFIKWYKMCFNLSGSTNPNSSEKIIQTCYTKFEEASKSPMKTVSSFTKPSSRGRSLSSPFVTQYLYKEIKENQNNNYLCIEKNDVNILSRFNSPISDNMSSFHDDFDEKLILNYKNENNETNTNFNFKIQKSLFENCLKNRSKFLERVSKGPPNCFRWLSWKICLNVSNEVKEEIYEFFVEKKLNEEIDNQIKKDLNRTLSNEPIFNHVDSQISLYRILRAFANVDNGVTYCQGMNFIVGFLLIVSDFNEVEIFFMLISLFSADTYNREYMHVCQYGLRGFFFDDFPLLKFYINLFDHFFNKKLPNLRNHFNNIELPNEMWISKWFQTMFTICMPIHAVVRIWDCILSLGITFMIKFTLAFLKSREEELLKLDEAFDLNEYFRNYFYKENFDVEEIIQIARKIEIDKSSIAQVKKEYEENNKINLNKLKIKYDLSVKDDLSIITVIQEVNHLSGSYAINSSGKEQFTKHSPYLTSEIVESEVSSICSFLDYLNEKDDSNSNIKENNFSNTQNADNFFKNPSQFVRSYTCNESTASNLNQNNKNYSNKNIPVIYITSVTENCEEEDRNDRRYPNYFNEDKIMEEQGDPSDCNDLETNEYNTLYNINNKVSTHTLCEKKVGLGRFNVNQSISPRKKR
jgi:hypothetical protein